MRTGGGAAPVGRAGRWRRRLGLGLVAAVLLGACGPRFDETAPGGDLETPAATRRPSTPGPAAPPAEPAVPAVPPPLVTDDEVRFGLLIPVTGAAPVPDTFDRGVNAYIDVVNERGGVRGRRVRILIEDTQSQAEVAKDKAKKLIEQDRVLGIVALDRLENHEALIRYLDPRRVPNVHLQTPAGLPAERRWTFNITIDQGDQGRLVADYFVKALGARRVAIITENTPLLAPGRRQFLRRARQLGAQVVYERRVEGQQTEFATEALALSQRRPQAVWLYMAPTTAASLANQTEEAGFHPTWFANSISWGFNLTFSVAPKALRGARAFSPWLPLDDPRTRAYQRAYRRLNPGTEPDDLGIIGWGIGQILVEAARRAGPDLTRESFRAAMQNLDFRADVWVPIRFGPGVRTGTRSVAVLRERNGRWVLERDFTTRF
jgi:branched-chain amino acid transport system substrate-binding protein